MNMKQLTLTSLTLAGVLVCTASAQVTISTDFDSSTAKANKLPHVDNVESSNTGTQNTGWDTQDWTQTDPTQFGVAGLDSLSFNANYSWGNSGTPIAAGMTFATLKDGAYLDPSGNGNSSGTRRNAGADVPLPFNGADPGSFNHAAPLSELAVYNTIVEFGSGTSFTQLDFSFRAGTATAGGDWRSGTAGTGNGANGDYTFKLSSISVSGSDGALGSVVASSSGNIGAGTGPTVTDSVTGTFTPGLYLMQIELSGQDDERAGIGELSVSAVPEPSTYAAIIGALALAGVMLRRRLRS